MKALTSVAIVCGIAALATGCATQWPTPQDEVAELIELERYRR